MKTKQTSALTPRQWQDLLRKSEPEFYALTQKYWAAVRAFNIASTAIKRGAQGVPVEYRVSGMWTAIAHQMTHDAERTIAGHRAAWARGEGDTPVSRWHVKELERMSRAIKRRCAAGERKTTANQARIAKARANSGLRAAQTALDAAEIDIREYEPKTAVGLRAQLQFIRDRSAFWTATISGLRRLIEAENAEKSRALVNRAVARARRKVKTLSKSPAHKRAA